MQNDAFKRFSKDLQDALVMPVNYLNKKAKKIPMGGDNSSKKKKGTGGLAGNGFLRLEKTTSDTVSLHNFSLSTISKASDDNQSFTSNGSGGFGRSMLSPGYSKVFPKEEPAWVHCPPSVETLDQFSPERHAWVRHCLQQSSLSQLSNVLKSEHAWDTVDEGHFQHNNRSNSLDDMPADGRLVKSGYNNTNEATGLLLVKLMQVTNKATSKVFDVEWNLRVGNVERTSHASRSFKDNPGNTASMNEVFLFDVNEAFQLDIEVTGMPVVTKFGTMAGFSNTQPVNLGQLQLAFCLEPMEKSVRTYKLRRPLNDGQNLNGSKSNVKADCEIVVMIALHVHEEPIEDRSWETEALYQGMLTVMTRGSRMAAWKRYWAVLEGAAFKLYDAEYQLKRDPVATVPLAHILSVLPPDYDKVDVGANGFSIAVDPRGVNMKNQAEFDLTDMDYCIYAFTDSGYLHEVWNANLEEALDQYHENMARRQEIQQAKMTRRASRSLSRQSFESSMPPSPLEDEQAETPPCLIDLKFVS